MEPASTLVAITTTVAPVVMSARLVNPARAEYVHVTQAPAPMAVVTRVASASREQLAAPVGREAPRVRTAPMGKPARTRYVQMSVTQAPALMAVATRVARARM